VTVNAASVTVVTWEMLHCVVALADCKRTGLEAVILSEGCHEAKPVILSAAKDLL
jgi:hypothetical protein